MAEMPSTSASLYSSIPSADLLIKVIAPTSLMPKIPSCTAFKSRCRSSAAERSLASARSLSAFSATSLLLCAVSSSSFSANINFFAVSSFCICLLSSKAVM